MAFEIRTFSPEEAALFYSNDEKDKELGCIGHLRGDFGHKGKEFWHTWFDHQAELNTPEFKVDIAAVINELHARGPLKDLGSMANYCYEHREAQIQGAWHPDTYGFCVDTDRYRYCIRCFPQQGDNNFYVYCYQHKNERQHEKTEGGQIQPAPKKKRHQPER
jgi:hypothetical protein